MTELQTTWTWLIAVYLFLGGLGAGAMCTTAIIGLASGERFKNTIRFGSWTGAVAIAVGTLFLLIDVGKPFRALVLFRSFVNFDSWMAIGAWLLMAVLLINGVSALMWTDAIRAWLQRLWKPLADKRRIWRYALAAIAIPLNLCVAAYTGILIGVLPFRPLWNTWLLPMLFTVSALDTGVGLVTAFFTLREPASNTRRLRIILEACIIALIASEAVVLGFFLTDALRRSPDAVLSAQTLISGVLGPAFWIAVVGLGLGLPLLVCVSQLSGLLKRNKTAAVVVPLVGVVGCLIGGWMLRFLVLSAGQAASLSSPAMAQIRDGVRFIP